jgi:hypothetical protein
MKVFFIISGIIPILLVMAQLALSVPTYETNDDSAHGIRFSANDQFMVWAFNNVKMFRIFFPPYESTEECSLSYNHDHLYIYSLATIINNDNTTSSNEYSFVYVAEETTTQDVYFVYYTLNRLACGMS